METKEPKDVCTDGMDFKHRQIIANHYQISAQYKFYLKGLILVHFLTLFAMWSKVGSEILAREFGIASTLWKRLDLPTADLWEHMWCLSIIPCICAILSFPRNNVNYLQYHYYGHFAFGILPCILGIGSQIPDLYDYLSDRWYNKTSDFKGNFPMAIIWYIFFLVALQIHCFAMYFSTILLKAWRPASMTRNNEQAPNEKGKSE